MANPISPLQTSRVLGQKTPDSQAGVIMEEITGFGFIQFAAWGATLAQTGAEAARVAGCIDVPKPGQMVQGSQGMLMRVEPLKWWLITPSGSEAPQPKLPTDQCVVLDLLQSRCWLRISGNCAETLLNHFLPLNLRPSAFAVGTVASTAFHHVGVTLWRDEHGFNLLIPRSSAVSLWELLSESARQYGLAEK